MKAKYSIIIALSLVFLFPSWDVVYVIDKIGEFRTRDIWRHSLFDTAGYVLIAWNVALGYRFKGKPNSVVVLLFPLLLLQLVSIGWVIETGTMFFEDYIFEPDELASSLAFLGVFILPAVAIFFLAVYGSWRLSRRPVVASDSPVTT
jgi:hypothetical protein